MPHGSYSWEHGTQTAENAQRAGMQRPPGVGAGTCEGNEGLSILLSILRGGVLNTTISILREM